MSKRYKDFDAAKEASNPEPIVVKVNGKEYTFPPFLSASVVLSQMSWLNADGSLSASNLIDWFESIFGGENLEELKEEVSFDQLQEIANFLLAEYGMGGDVVTEDTEVEIDGEQGDGDSPK
tara:strand:- start:9880 stop:10242 length:363 start_codon:yes stop_codon:yes gene_type:complete